MIRSNHFHSPLRRTYNFSLFLSKILQGKEGHDRGSAVRTDERKMAFGNILDQTFLCLVGEGVTKHDSVAASLARHRPFDESWGHQSGIGRSTLQCLQVLEKVLSGGELVGDTGHALEKERLGRMSRELDGEAPLAQQVLVLLHNCKLSGRKGYSLGRQERHGSKERSLLVSAVFLRSRLGNQSPLQPFQPNPFRCCVLVHDTEQPTGIDDDELAVLNGPNWQQGAYYLGDWAPMLYVVQSWRNLIAIDTRRCDELAAWMPPKVPICGTDLLSHGVDKGPVIGHMLKAAEDKWVASLFTIQKRALLKWLLGN